ncbi:peptidase activity protein [[Candida] boidinii]|nr:peptidase activity protein [[Candida] boidinii]
MSAPLIKLNSGNTIPAVGLGVYLASPEDASNIIYKSLNLGYRHVDSAAFYHNEFASAEGIAQWLAEDPVNNKREDVFYTTKIWNADHGYEKTKKAIEVALEKAKSIDYIDLILMHSPQSDFEKRHGSWLALQEAVDSGKVKDIGVSNYGVKHIVELLNYPDLKYKPVVNQIEIHPWFIRNDINDFCKKNNIVLEAYSPFAKGRKFDDPILKKVADKYGKTPAQILVRWSLDKGFVVLPKSVKEERAASNIDVFDFKLKNEDIKLLDEQDAQMCTGWDPTTYPLDYEK